MGKRCRLAALLSDKRRTMMLGLLLGLAGGIGLAFLLEQLDNTLKTPEEAERYCGWPAWNDTRLCAVNGKTALFQSCSNPHAELPVRRRKTANDSQSGILLDHDPLSVVGEAYRSFRSACSVSAGGPPHTMPGDERRARRR